MKKKYVLFLLLSLTTSGFCQEIKISPKALPVAVIQAFRSAYPNSRIRRASKEIEKGDSFYEINCKDSAAARTVTISSDGKIMETETEITADKLPDAVANAILKQYAKGKIMRIEESVRDSKTVYEVLIKDKKKKMEAVFSPDGSIVSAK